jgi:hypothetical protein
MYGMSDVVVGLGHEPAATFYGSAHEMTKMFCQYYIDPSTIFLACIWFGLSDEKTASCLYIKISPKQPPLLVA